MATACMLEQSPAADFAVIPDGKTKSLQIEHPIGEVSVLLDLDDQGEVQSAAILRTARKLFEGTLYSI